MPNDIEQSFLTAWQTIAPRLRADPDELRARLARRRSATFGRALRAWSIAIRANDTRINPYYAIVTPHHALDPASPYHFGQYTAHTVTLDAALIRLVTQSLYLHPPGEPHYDIARRLGVKRLGLRGLCSRPDVHVHHLKGLGGRRGKPTPMIYTEQTLDPNARSKQAPDQLFAATWEHLPQSLPNDFEQTVRRIPAYTHPPKSKISNLPNPQSEIRNPQSPPPLKSEIPNPEISNPSPLPNPKSKLQNPKSPPSLKSEISNSPLPNPQSEIRNPQSPPSPPSPHHDPRDALLDQLADLRSHSPKPPRFLGWRWECPGCHQPAKTLFYPLPPPDWSAYIRFELPADEAALEHDPAPTFACERCHNILRFSRATLKKSWDQFILRLSGGLLFGREVPMPPWLIEQRKRPYKPRPRPSRRKEQLARLLATTTQSPEQIAQELGLKFHSLQCIRSRIFRDYKVKTRDQLRAAYENKPRPPDHPNPNPSPNRPSDPTLTRAVCIST